jgi:hypothetical protein
VNTVLYNLFSISLPFLGAKTYILVQSIHAQYGNNQPSCGNEKKNPQHSYSSVLYNLRVLGSVSQQQQQISTRDYLTKMGGDSTYQACRLYASRFPAVGVDCAETPIPVGGVHHGP